MARDIWSTELDMSPWADDFGCAFELFWKTYVDPNTGIIYDAPIDACVRQADKSNKQFVHGQTPTELPSIIARPDLGAWPTPDEIAASIPTINGWDTAIENAPAEGGTLLAALSRGALSISDTRRRECINHLYKGLISLWTVPGQTGFICRGYLPDTKAFYKQTSLDQLPLYVFGLYTYARSPYCTDLDRDEIAQCTGSILAWMENAGWRLTLFNDLRQTPHSNCRALDPTHITKMFALLLMTWQLTGNDHWYDIYQQWRDEDGGKYLHAISNRDKTWQTYQLMYAAILLDQLAAHDKDAPIVDFYREQKWLLMHPLALFCSRHVYAQYQPTLPNILRSIHNSPDVMIDFRPALARAVGEVSFEPNNARFMWIYREHLERYRMEQDVHGDGWLTYDYFTAAAAHQVIMRNWPEERPSWGAERTRATLEGFFSRLCFDHPLRFFPKLALSTIPGFE